MVRYFSSGPRPEPAVALAGDKLWFSYGCRSSAGHLGSFDLTDPAAPPVLDRGGYLTFEPRSPAHPGVKIDTHRTG